MRGGAPPTPPTPMVAVALTLPFSFEAVKV